MTELEHAIAIASQGTSGQDRAAVFERGPERVLVVADGAGGTSGGAAAAELVVEQVRRVVESGANLKARGLWRQTLLEASIALEAVGQTTAVVIGGGWGASVGDSGAWRVRADGWDELTAGQPRKPLLGGGHAEPLIFPVDVDYDETLLLASDGLFKYAKAERLCELARRPSLDAAGLVDAARLPGGGLQDDVAVVLLRRSRAVWTKTLRDPGADERALWLAIQRFISSALPPEQRPAFDGVRLDVREPQRLAGRLWTLPGGLDPFELRLEADRIEVTYRDFHRTVAG